MSFDSFADDYDTILEEGLRVTGESKEFFARSRILWLQNCMQGQLSENKPVESILDFGCGIGDTGPILQEAFPGARVLGVDDSPRCIARARETIESETITFVHTDEWTPEGTFDLVYCNGVFHHIPPSDRPAALKQLHAALRPGGFFAFWENNPLNPGTQYLMWKVSFDRGAQKIRSGAARRLLQSQGFVVVSTHFLFLFPSILKWFRPLERLLTSFPFGAQYQVLTQKPRV